MTSQIKRDEVIANRLSAENLSADGPRENITRAKETLEHLKFYAVMGWSLFFQMMASPATLIPNLFILAIVILSSNQLSCERDILTWLVICNTINGRRVFLRNKFMGLLSISMVLSTVLFWSSFMGVMKASGDFVHADKTFSQTFLRLPLIDISLFCNTFLAYTYWLLAMLPLCSYILFFSAACKNGLMSFMLSFTTMVMFPAAIGAVSSSYPLVFPANILGFYGLCLNPPRLDTFLSYRPWLPNHGWSPIIYAAVVPIMLTAVLLRATKLVVRKWF